MGILKNHFWRSVGKFGTRMGCLVFFFKYLLIKMICCLFPSLSPERELLRQQHEEIISQLNQKMADKAT